MRILPTFLLSLAAVLCLSACTTTGTGPAVVRSETSGLPEDDPVAEQYNERIAAVAREVRAVCSAATAFSPAASPDARACRSVSKAPSNALRASARACTFSCKASSMAALSPLKSVRIMRSSGAHWFSW